MRIISGIAKGRKLFTPPPRDKRIRPTSDKARGAIFNILGDSVRGAKVLDLFAGTGAMGLEAFSRNASLVVFIDNDRLALDLIKRNIGLCLSRYTGDCEFRVIQHDLTKGLPSRDCLPGTSAGFDLIFADPPYGQDMSQFLLNTTLADVPILAENGTLIVEERFNIRLPDKTSQFTLVDKRVYGETGFWLYNSSHEQHNLTG